MWCFGCLSQRVGSISGPLPLQRIRFAPPCNAPLSGGARSTMISSNVALQAGNCRQATAGSVRMTGPDIALVAASSRKLGTCRAKPEILLARGWRPEEIKAPRARERMGGRSTWRHGVIQPGSGVRFANLICRLWWYLTVQWLLPRTAAAFLLLPGRTTFCWMRIIRDERRKRKDQKREKAAG